MLTLNFRNGIVTVSVSVICAYRGEKELCEGIFPDGYLQIKCFSGFPPSWEGKGDNEDGDLSLIHISHWKNGILWHLQLMVMLLS